MMPLPWNAGTTAVRTYLRWTADGRPFELRVVTTERPTSLADGKLFFMCSTASIGQLCELS
jgi:hypothetical protein